MEIPGWVYLIVGIIVSGFSGYVYYYVPKPDGSPNMAMAFFFFIGIIFIVVGVFKIMFKKITKRHEEIAEHNMRIKEKSPQIIESKPNKVEEKIKSMQQPQENPPQSTPKHHHLEHSNRWYQSHPYKGPHNQKIQSQQYTIVSCPKCSAKNHSTSNFCHVCGTKIN